MMFCNGLRWFFGLMISSSTDTQCQKHPNPPLELIERWQGYLTKSEEICTHDYCRYPYEKRWQNCTDKGVVDFNKPLLPFDEEEFVRDWEDALESAYVSENYYKDIGWIPYGPPS
jgi:hypothetical protein